MIKTKRPTQRSDVTKHYFKGGGVETHCDASLHIYLFLFSKPNFSFASLASAESGYLVITSLK